MNKKSMKDLKEFPLRIEVLGSSRIWIPEFKITELKILYQGELEKEIQVRQERDKVIITVRILNSICQIATIDADEIKEFVADVSEMDLESLFTLSLISGSFIGFSVITSKSFLEYIFMGHYTLSFKTNNK
jgi:hypothetical protein